MGDGSDLMSGWGQRWKVYLRSRLHPHLDEFERTGDKFHFYMAINYIDALAHGSILAFRLRGNKFSWEE